MNSTIFHTLGGTSLSAAKGVVCEADGTTTPFVPQGVPPKARRGGWDIAKRCPRTRHRNRRGAAIVFALVCLIMAAVMATVLVRLALLGWKSARDEGRSTQAQWLVESGLDRAAARLATDPAYSGETWRIPAEAFAGRRDAVVLIEVAPLPDEPSRRTVRVRADYPDDPINRVRKTKQLTVTLPKTEPRP